MLKIEQIELIRKKFYVGASTGKISEISLMSLSEAVVVNLVKRRREVYFMTPSQNSFLSSARKDRKNWGYNLGMYHGIACVRKLRELKKTINYLKKWV
jgi:hypothetical protein